MFNFFRKRRKGHRKLTGRKVCRCLKLEPLESRQMMSVAPSGPAPGTVPEVWWTSNYTNVEIRGTNNADTITLSQERAADGQWFLHIEGTNLSKAPWNGNIPLSAISTLTIYGYGGNDTITNINANFSMKIHGGDNDDTLRNAAPAPVTIYGDAGNDLIYGSSSADQLDGGDGNDTIYAGPIATSVTANGTVYILSDQGDVYLSAGDDKWDKITGDRITTLVTANNNVYVLTDRGEVYRYTGGGNQWNKITGSPVTTLVAADQNVYVLSLGEVYRYTGGGNQWNKITGSPISTLVAAAGNVYVLTGQDVYRYTGSGGSWNKITGGPITTLVAAAGNVYVLSGQDVYRYTGSGGSWNKITGDPISTLVAADQKVYVLTMLGDVYRYTGVANRWDKITGDPIRTLVAADQKVYVLTTPGDVYRYTGISNQWDKILTSVQDFYLVHGLEIYLANNVLYVQGTSGNDHLEFWRSNERVHIKPFLPNLGIHSDLPRTWPMPSRIEVNGGDGNDFIANKSVLVPVALKGGRGNDNLIGGACDDILDGGEGDDLLDGGAGNDTISFAESSSGVRVDLNHNYAVGQGHDVIANFENVIGSQWSDIITGNTGNNKIYGLNGDDDLHGYDGDDLLVGGLGDDMLNGGDGNDSVSYEGASQGVHVRLFDRWSDGQGRDSLHNLENIFGSEHNDWLEGDDSSNVLYGLGGNDDIYGLAGNDRLYGGDGDDDLYGNVGDDGLFGGMADGTQPCTDRLHGGPGADRFLGPQNRPRFIGEIGGWLPFWYIRDLESHDTYITFANFEGRWSNEEIEAIDTAFAAIVDFHGSTRMLRGRPNSNSNRSWEPDAWLTWGNDQANDNFGYLTFLRMGDTSTKAHGVHNNREDAIAFWTNALYDNRQLRLGEIVRNVAYALALYIPPQTSYGFYFSPSAEANAAQYAQIIVDFAGDGINRGLRGHLVQSL